MIIAKIVDRETGRVVDTCTGPDGEGICPRENESGHVPCAGMLLESAVPEVGWSVTIPVGAGARKCPLRGFAVPAPDRDRWL